MPRVPARRPKKARAAAPVSVGLAGALFTNSQQRVLALLFGQPARSFYANELIALTRGGSGAVQRELARLTQSGLVTVRASGNQKHYQANSESPVFHELTGIVRKTIGLADPLREALRSVDEKVHAAFVYGSVAKGEDTAGSDIDLLIMGDDITYADVFEALESAGQQLGRKVNPTIYSAAELSKRIKSRGSFVTRVLEQPKIWLKGDERDLAA